MKQKPEQNREQLLLKFTACLFKFFRTQWLKKPINNNFIILILFNYPLTEYQ